MYLLASTDAGPVVNWFDQSSQDMEATNSIYLVTLQKNVLSPFAKENETEEIKDTASAKTSAKPDSSKTNLKIDWDGIQNRIVPLPLPQGIYRSLAVPKEGELYYVSVAPHNAAPNTLHNYSLKKRKDENIMPADGYIIAAKGEKMLFVNRGKWG